jgi:hypothetical protein
MELAIRKSDNEVMNDRQSGKLSLPAITQQFIGQPDDYELVAVPLEQEEPAMKARYISFDGQSFSIDDRPLLEISGMQITITAGWVRGNERLTDDVVMDIPMDSGNNRELEIEVVKDDATGDIEVVKYLWLETEDKGEMPSGKSFISSILGLSIPAGTTDLTEVEL